MKLPLLMAPAGSDAALEAALNAGAGAVYFGVGALNMRSGAAVNFRESDLGRVVERCHACGAKAYLTLNIIVFDGELERVAALCRTAGKAGVDAVIASDPAVILEAGRNGLPVHLSVQANISNIEAVRFYSKFAEVVVLARELKLADIRDIVGRIAAEDVRSPSGRLIGTELFIHGALCSSFSGKCYLSLTAANCSANRGVCRQTCRRRYILTDAASGERLEMANGYVMSAADLCMINFMPEVVASGVDILKIEGRGRSADYVGTITRVYRQALEACAAGTFTPAAAAGWRNELTKVFNRGFWDGGYYLGEDFGVWSGCGGNRSPVEKTMIGKVIDYYAKIGVAEIVLSSGDLSAGDQLLVVGSTTGAQEAAADGFRIGDGKVMETHAAKGSTIALPLAFKVRSGDIVYRLTDRAFSGIERKI
ncbi:MAG: U32 family peptidase [Victivallaceae bacterium]|nr:U32 family peptidase [Victivallaceae bacterium]